MEMTQLIQDTKDAIAEYQAAGAALRSVILGQGFVVRCQGVCLSFDIGAARAVSDPRPSQPHRATRFTRGDAEAVAASVKNGNGEAGQALHVRLAVEDALEQQKILLATLEAHQAKQPSFSVEVAQ